MVTAENVVLAGKVLQFCNVPQKINYCHIIHPFLRIERFAFCAEMANCNKK
jgi:hypothetical protein